MKKFEYKGNFQNDVVKIIGKFNFKDFLKQQTLTLCAYLFLYGFVCIAFGVGVSAYVLLVVASTLLQTGFSVIYNSVIGKKESKETLNKVCHLYQNMDLDYGNLEKAKEKIKESSQNTTLTNESYTYVDGKLEITEKEFTTDFYLLDAKEQLKVLREVKNIIINKKNKTEKYSLYLLEDEDLKNLEKEKTLSLKK